jgi:hypothetical protein
MAYHANDKKLTLQDLRARLEKTDLIPSHQALLDGHKEKVAALNQAKIASVADLRLQLKTKKSLAALALASGLDAGYLSLLRRVVEGFFPKPLPLKTFTWLDKGKTAKLEQAGISDTLACYQATQAGMDGLAKRTGLAKQSLAEYVALSDLSRVQWVSPTFARTLFAAGFTSTAKLGKADPQVLYDAVLNANEGGGFYKGKVGLRDIKRLIVAASFVP